MRKILLLLCLFSITADAQQVQNTYGIDFLANNTMAVSGVTRARIRYNSGTNQFEQSLSGAAYVAFGGGGGGGTLASDYASGAVAADQTPLIQAGNGGPVIFKANGAGTGSLLQSQTSSTAVLFNILDNSTNIIRSGMSDGGTANSLIVDTTSTWSNPTAQLFTVENNATDTFHVLPWGGLSMGLGAALFNPASSPITLNISQPAHNSLTGGVEINFVNIDSNAATLNFNTAAIANQRYMLVNAPTYSFVSASTITNAATFAVTGAAINGGNATFTHNYSIWSQDGIVDADVASIGTSIPSATKTALIINNPTSGSRQFSPGLAFMGFGNSVSAGAALQLATKTDGSAQDLVFYVSSNGLANFAEQLRFTNGVTGYPNAIQTITSGANAVSMGLLGQPTLTNGIAVAIDSEGTMTGGKLLSIRNNGSSGEVAFFGFDGQTSLGVGPALASGVPKTLTVTQPAHTGLTAATEVNFINFNSTAATLQWATNNFTTERYALFRAPVLTAVGATTITNAATLAVDAAPTCNSNMTCTNKYALWIQAGTTQLDAQVNVKNLVTTSAAPACAVGAACNGAGSSCTVTGTNEGGTVQIVVGATPTTNNPCVTLTYASLTCPNGSSGSFQEQDKTTRDLFDEFAVNREFWTNGTTTTLVLSMGYATAVSGTMTFNYHSDCF